MLVIMDELWENQEQDEVSNVSFHSSFSRIHSDELNNMGYGLNRISPITFEGDVFQTPNNRTQRRVLTSTPRKKMNETQGPPVNKMFLANQVPRWDEQLRSKSYDAEMSIRYIGTAEPFGRYIPPHQTNADNFASGSSEDLQHFNQTTVFNGQINKTIGAGQPRNTGIQMSPGELASTGITGAMQTLPKKSHR